jgi:non-specific serine/threonine protein kinase/protein-serine/threonine kinase
MAKVQLDAGATIDGFLLEERIHRGGMATIWRVTRPDIGFPIAMKVPLLDFEGDISLLVGFEVEQMIMAEVTGPHVPRWVANGDFAVLPYIVMEYIPGSTLLKRLTSGPMPLDEVGAIGIGMAAALGDLHLQHVLHLDLKPANILFRASGEAVLIDFGLSRHEQLPDLLEEQFHRPTGTAEYMAPEQLGRVRSDRRSDIFALGAILYQMATGELPFGIPGRMAGVRDRVWRAPLPPRALRPDISPALQEVILKCLEPMPDARYKTADELQFDLRHLDLVELTGRSERLRPDDFRTRFGRWIAAGKTMRHILASSTKPPPQPPIVLAAVDLRPANEDLRQALLDGAASVLANMPGARLACVNVLQTSLLAIDENVDAAGENIHVQRLAALRAWARPLQLPRGKVSFHLVEASNIAAGIIDFARSNGVGHIVIGAPTVSGSFASRLPAQITAEAPCTVTVIRVPGAGQRASELPEAAPAQASARASGLTSVEGGAPE